MDSILEPVKSFIYFSTAKYLAFFAKIKRQYIKAQIVAVTGSTGKSSLVSLIVTILKAGNKEFVYAEHVNSAHGIPMHLLNLTPTEALDTKQKIIDWSKILVKAPLGISPFHLQKLSSPATYYVFEEDSDRPGEVLLTGKVLRSNILIWLNASVVHAAFHDKNMHQKKFASIEESVADDFAQSIRQMDPSGLAILNIDDPMINALKKQSRGVYIEVGKDTKAIKLKSYAIEGLVTKFIYTIDKAYIQKELEVLEKMHSDIFATWPEQIEISIKGFLLPEYFYSSFAASIIFSLYTNISYEEFQSGIALYRLPPGRMSIFQGINNTCIIDSSYNASPEALTGALTLLAEYESTIAILGDMRELGKETKQEHEKIAKTILDKKIDKVFLTGDAMYTYVYPYLKEHGYPESNLVAFRTSKELKEFIEKNKEAITPNAVILVKGSQNTIYLESIVERLLKNKEDIEHLARRGKEWEEKRLACGL